MRTIIYTLFPYILKDVEELQIQARLLESQNKELAKKARQERVARYDAEEMARTIEGQLVEYYELKLTKLKKDGK